MEMIVLYRPLVPGHWFLINQRTVVVGTHEHHFFAGKGWKTKP